MTREVNCHIPLRLRVIGDLDDAQRDSLRARLVTALTVRIGAANQHIEERVGAIDAPRLHAPVITFAPSISERQQRQLHALVTQSIAAALEKSGLLLRGEPTSTAPAEAGSPLIPVGYQASSRPPTARTRRTARADAPARAARGDPVVLMEISVSTGHAALTTRGGARYDGRVTDLNLEPGVYHLQARYAEHRWRIPGTQGGLRFTLELPEPDRGDGTQVAHIDPFSLRYDHTLLRITPGPRTDAASDDDPTAVDLDTRMHMVGERLDATYVTAGDEEVLIHLIEGAPQSQSVEFLQRLTERRPNGHSWLEDLDRRIDGENNQRLHEGLSLQRLRAAPERAAAALADAPVLPWHDNVMGFFEDAATFIVERSRPGYVRVRYLGGGRLITSREYGREITGLPSEIFIGGVEYADDQPLIIHDYESARFVTLVAGELAGYEHLGIRNFLGNVATVASLAMPLSAARTVAGRVAVVALERALPALFLVVEENRQNIVRWFPNWGPEMIRYADTVKAGVAAIGIGQMAVSAFQIFQQWRRVLNARAALDGAVQLDTEARRVMAALERDAEAAIAHAEAVHMAETTPGAPIAGGEPEMPSASGRTTAATPRSGSAATGAGEKGIPAAAPRIVRTVDQLSLHTLSAASMAERAAIEQVSEDRWTEILDYARRHSAAQVKGKIAEELFVQTPEFNAVMQGALARAASENIPEDAVQFVRDIRGIAPTRTTAGAAQELTDGAIVAIHGERARILAVFESKSPGNRGALAHLRGDYMGQIGWDLERFAENPVIINGRTFRPEQVSISRHTTDWIGITPPGFDLSAGQQQAIRSGMPEFQLFHGPVRDDILDLLAQRVRKVSVP